MPLTHETGNMGMVMGLVLPLPPGSVSELQLEANASACREWQQMRAK